jgi:hypothetical protein
MNPHMRTGAFVEPLGNIEVLLYRIHIYSKLAEGIAPFLQCIGHEIEVGPALFAESLTFYGLRTAVWTKHRRLLKKTTAGWSD